MLHEVERLALRNAFGDVEQHNVAELFEANKMGERAANLAGTDQCNLGTRHVRKNLGWGAAETPAKRVIDRFRPALELVRLEAFVGVIERVGLGLGGGNELDRMVVEGID